MSIGQSILTNGWAHKEFGEVDFGDERLTNRLIKLTNSLSESPESSINQACGSWSETKAAYRFFQNNSVSESRILNNHVEKTVERASKHKTILAIQDTSYISYENHKKTKGLGVITSVGRPNKANFEIHGLVMHSAFAVTTEGLALGLLDQKIYSRPQVSEEIKVSKKRSRNSSKPIESKESIRWIESLKQSNEALASKGVQMVTVADREADIYDLLEVACHNEYLFLIRANQNRNVNRRSLHSKTDKQKLWSLLQSYPCQGNIELEIPARDNKPSRKAILEVRFRTFIMNPPRGNIRLKTEKLPNLQLSAIYVIEKNAPKQEDQLEWMLLTNLPVNSFDEAIEKIRWYCLRWRIEIFHKILKSGLKIEECRLGTAQRLIRYLTVMSIIAWRIFFITLIARENPSLPCTTVLSEEEWKVLYVKTHRSKTFPRTAPTIKEAVRWIAQLGGFLARKGDREPGPITLWRGWKRLFDLSEGWYFALT